MRNILNYDKYGENDGKKCTQHIRTDGQYMQTDGTSKKKQKEMLGIKNTLTQIKNAFEVLISRLDMTEERISDLEDMTVEISKPEQQTEKRLKKTQGRIFIFCVTTTTGVTYIYWDYLKDINTKAIFEQE